MEEELLNLLTICTNEITVCIKVTSDNLKNKITSDFQKMEAPFKESVEICAKLILNSLHTFIKLFTVSTLSTYEV